MKVIQDWKRSLDSWSLISLAVSIMLSQRDWDHFCLWDQRCRLTCIGIFTCWKLNAELSSWLPLLDDVNSPTKSAQSLTVSHSHKQQWNRWQVLKHLPNTWSVGQDHQTRFQFSGNKLTIWRKRPKPTAITNTCQEQDKTSPGLMISPRLLCKESLLQNSRLIDSHFNCTCEQDILIR